MSKRPFLFLVVFLWSLCAALVPVGSASAHAGLVSADPADGSSSVGVPQTVTLTFTDEIGELGTSAQVEGPSEVQASTAIDGRTVTVTLSPQGEAAAGTYTLSYRVTSADGHPVAGRLNYQVTAAQVTATPATPSSSSPAEVTSTTKPSASLNQNEGQVVNESTTWPWIVAGVLIACVAAAVLVGRSRGRSAEQK